METRSCTRCRHPFAAHYPARSHPLVNLGSKHGTHDYLTLRCEECAGEGDVAKVCPMGTVEELMARFREIRREFAAPPGMETAGEPEPLRALKARVLHQGKPHGEAHEDSTDGKGEQTPAKH